MSELLTNVLNEEEENLDLYNYIQTALRYLDNETNFANFHLLFVLKLSRYLGFQPDRPNDNSNYFNLVSGYFEESSEGKYSVSGKNLTLLKTLLGINFDTLTSIRLNATERQDFLSMLLVYFELHLEGFKKPKSLYILREIFQ